MSLVSFRHFLCRLFFCGPGNVGFGVNVGYVPCFGGFWWTLVGVIRCTGFGCPFEGFMMFYIPCQ